MKGLLTDDHQKKIQKSTFLLTGGAGFIGSHLVDALIENGAKYIIVVDDLSTGSIKNLERLLNYPNFEFHNVSICDENKIINLTKGIDFVFHQAALGSVPRSISTPEATHNANVNGFFNVLNACRVNKVKRFVYASSSSVYGDDQVMPKKEGIEGNLLSPYAATKHINEIYAKVFSTAYGLETVGLRYFNVFGPRQNPKGPYAAVIPLFVSAMLRNESPVIFGDGTTTRDFTFVRNVVNANLLAVVSENDFSQSTIMNVACGGTISLNDLFEKIAAIIGFDQGVTYLDERRGDIKSSFADISKVKETLKYLPEVDIDKGLEITINWFKQNL
jgi:UDP-N-acetylglucosamine/UDP-N-acetylgalactosamine 4-epimerase